MCQTDGQQRLNLKFHDVMRNRIMHNFLTVFLYLATLVGKLEVYTKSTVTYFNTEFEKTLKYFYCTINL